MRPINIALAGTLLLGCQPATVDSGGAQTEQTAAYSASPASQCNGGDTFVAPQYNLLDLGAVLAKVTYFSLGPAQFEELFSGSWTNWYKADMNTGLAKLATMRGVLDKYNLHDTYLPGSRPQVNCAAVDTTVRQYDGTCNDLVNTTAGAVGARIGRNIPVFLPSPSSPTGYAPNPKAYPASTDAALLTPNPREVSRALFTRGASGMKPVPFLNLLAAAWIQFQVHDWFDHDNESSPELFHLPLVADDPLRAAPFNLTELLVPKTMRDTSALGQPLPPVYHNLVTHWWDGSQMYGVTKAQSDALRAHVNGKVMAELAMDAKQLLPTASDGFEQTGLRKNWWLGLGVMHNVFAKEHNAVVAMLKQSHREHAGDEDWYFQHARMVVSAVIAKIHTIEWTPAILPNRTATVGLHANWSGLKSFLDPLSKAGLPAFMLAAKTTIEVDPLLSAEDKKERIASTNAAMMGVIGGETNNHGVPYSLTEEFTSVYRMHPLLPDAINIVNLANQTKATVTLEQMRMAGARQIEEAYGMDNVVFSFGVQHPGALVLGNYPKVMQQLQLPFGVVDMGAIDVLRDRERGIPRYNDFREQLRLKRVASIEELTNDASLRTALHNIYGSDAGAIDRVDALVGTFAEATRPSCYGFGETLFQVFTEMATRRLQADRFYTKDYNAATYTAEGIDWVTRASMKSVLLRAYPTLANTGLAASRNAFYPWQ
ncbi:MAG: Catalase [Myxococcales bacterium]|nr:Catalase [Myxococcales bacterium]